MFRIIQPLGVILIFGCCTWTSADVAQGCNAPPKSVCRCNISGVDVEVEHNASNNEVLVGVVSAMSSVVLCGSAFGLWMLLRGRCGPKPGLGRQESTASLITKDRLGQRNYGNVQGSEKPVNVYRSGLSDNVNHRSGRQGSANSYTEGTLSDWS